ncbi:GNAT family N-acetyltransferase [candidate division WOR-3 bacterium]|nr:GNAT family N-acetyltransferase [candidate division WOR-3 bacterium]
MFEYGDIILQQIEKEDLEFVKEIRNHYSTWKYLTTIGMFSSEKQNKWFSTITESLDVNYYIILSKEWKKIGYVRFDEIDWINRSVRVGADIHMQYRNKGYGKKVYKLILEFCFNYLNFNRAWLLVMENNEVALKLYKKIGFRTEGVMRNAIYRDGKYYGYIMMSILKEEYKND